MTKSEKASRETPLYLSDANIGTLVSGVLRMPNSGHDTSNVP